MNNFFCRVADFTCRVADFTCRVADFTCRLTERGQTGRRCALLTRFDARGQTITLSAHPTEKITPQAAGN